jgi:alkanesulfonate monooxygenase SsuD/methylene tetrahydromethanopterin reductase-like flavin-dependent oxidoreductase (luciferase family)
VIVGGHGKKRTPELAARYAAEFNVAFSPMDVVATQFERVDAACREIGRDPSEIVRSVAHTIAVGRTDADVDRRALTIGRDAADMRQNGFGGTPAQLVDKLGQWREKTGVTRVYLQLMDLADIDQIELIASEVAPQLG